MSYTVSNTGGSQHAALRRSTVNDPTYPGPGKRMHRWRRNMVLSLASTSLPKSIRDEVDHASDIEDLPPSYASVRAKIIEPPAGKTNSPRVGKYVIQGLDKTPAAMQGRYGGKTEVRETLLSTRSIARGSLEILIC